MDWVLWGLCGECWAGVEFWVQWQFEWVRSKFNFPKRVLFSSCVRLSSGRDHHRLRTPWWCWMVSEIPKVFAFQKHLLVADDVLGFQTGQNPHFVQRIFNFFLGKIGQLYFFQSIGLFVCQSLHFEHRRVCSLPLLNQKVPSFAPISKSFSDILNIIIDGW